MTCFDPFVLPGYVGWNPGLWVDQRRMKSLESITRKERLSIREKVSKVNISLRPYWLKGCGGFALPRTTPHHVRGRLVMERILLACRKSNQVTYFTRIYVFNPRNIDTVTLPFYLCSLV